MLALLKLVKKTTKPWREIFDPSGSNISQVNRCIK